MEDLVSNTEGNLVPVGVPAFEVCRQILVWGSLQGQQADVGSGDRPPLEVEYAANNGHVVLDQTQGQLALCLWVEFRPVRAVALGRGDNLE